MPVPTDLIEEHGHAVEELRNYIEEAEKGTIAEAEAEERYAKINDVLTATEQKIGEYRRLDDAEAELRAAKESGDGLGTGSEDGEDVVTRSDALAAEETELRSFLGAEDGPIGEAVELRALNWTTDSGTNNTASNVSEGFVNDLYVAMIERAAIRQTRVRTLRTPKGNSMKLPRVISRPFADRSVTTYDLAEGGALQKDDAGFDQVSIDAYKVGFIMELTHEVINDVDTPLVPILLDLAGEALADRTGYRALFGTGASQPQGLMTAATTGVTTASNAAVTGDELIDMQHSVIAPYRVNAEWLFNDTTLGVIRKLKDGNGNYLWSADYTGGAPGRLLGDPYVVDPYIADIGTLADFAAYGDMSRFMIRDVESVRVERSEHVGWENDLVSYRFIVRMDSELMDATGAIKLLTCPV